jgi:hypothetical protein
MSHVDHTRDSLTGEVLSGSISIPMEQFERARPDSLWDTVQIDDVAKIANTVLIYWIGHGKGHSVIIEVFEFK